MDSIPSLDPLPRFEASGRSKTNKPSEWGRSSANNRWMWLMPLVAIVLFVAVMMTLFWALRRDELERQQQTLYRDVQWAQQVMRLRLQADQNEVLTVARSMAQDGLDAQRFRSFSKHLLNAAPEVVSTAWIDPQHAIHWPTSSDGVLGPGLLREGEHLSAAQSVTTFQSARDTHELVYSHPYLASDGENYIDLNVPIVIAGHFEGTVLAVYSVTNLSRYVVPHESIQKYSMSIVDDRGALLAGISAPGQSDPGMSYELPFDPPGHGIYLHMSSYHIGSKLADNFLVWAVVALSLFIIWSLWALMRHSRHRLEAEAARDRLFNLSLDILCIMDARGELVRLNPACMRVLGRDPKALHGLSLLDLVHPDDRAATHDELRKLASGEASTSFENRCRRINTDGTTEYRWLVWTFNPDLQARPEKRLLYAVAHDVTLRRARQQALMAETAFRRAMEDSLLTGMRVIDMQGRITYVNPAFCRMLGYDEVELLGAAPPYPYWPKVHFSENQNTLKQILSGHAPSSGLEVGVLRKDGSFFDARMYVSPLIDNNGVQTGWMTSMTDITEPKRIRQELASAQVRFTTVLEELDAAVSVYSDLDSGEQLLFANRYYRQLFGTDATGHLELSVLRHDGPGALEDAPANEVHSNTADKWFEVRQRTIHWVDGRMVQMQVATDITARKATEELVRQQQEKVQLTSRLITMGEMASSLAHELNQPLTAIANYSMGTVARMRATIAHGGTSDPEELLQTLQKTSAQAERAGKIIRRIREFVKRSEPHRRVVKLRSIIDDAIGFAEIEAAKKRIVIRTHVPNPNASIEADPIMIEQVILNLLKNAVDAMHDAIVREIIVEVRDRGTHVEFSVIDHGEGIAPESHDKLFEPFYSTKAEGMGMGLNICRSIIEFHHGRLWAENNLAGGSTFHFTLPKHGVLAEALA